MMNISRPSMLFWGVIILVAPWYAGAQGPNREIPIVISAKAHPAELAAARDLESGLQRLYPQERFPVIHSVPESGRAIVVGNLASDLPIKTLVNSAVLSTPESYAVTTVREPQRELGILAGADARGVAYGASALLEKMGFGFYLSFDTQPATRQESFSFKEWSLANRPLVPDRIVFNWHNFLSGCSTWNLEEWQKWIRQSQKIGYNGVMVHAYGNNPMVSYEFNGHRKPVGSLSTTVKGRDWSTMHVNDVRRLSGGEVFSQAAFGAEAALVPNDQRADAAQKLMREVFASASQHAMNVYFANDVDTLSANPQEIIESLPRQARFVTSAGNFWLANPETEEGYWYYKTQVQALLLAYPQITTLVVWFRAGGTPWTELKMSEMPEPWQREYEAELKKTPEAAKLWHASQMFAIGKIIRAYDRALKELGYGHLPLASGTWGVNFLAPCDRFFPKHVKLIGLDYSVLHDRPQLGDAESRKVIRDVASHRKVVPVIWAHHDDGNYIGRPYTPFAEFHSKLADTHACGFGIIHWTTRPLDLFFTSHIKQVWRATENQPLSVTCEEAASKWFGNSARTPMAKYLEQWITEAPKFARETSDFFIDRPLTNVEQVIDGCRSRLQLLNKTEPTKATPEERNRIAYFAGLEEFIVAFYKTQDSFQRSQSLWKAGELSAARQMMAQCKPEPVIDQFAKFSALPGITRGEQGLVVSMNSRWLSHYLRYRQALGMEPVRYNFGVTSHDKLAQARGTFTYHFDSKRQIWQTLGTEETGASTFAIPPNAKLDHGAEMSESWEEICRQGIASERPIQFTMHPVMGKASLPQGQYRLQLLMVDPDSTATEQRVFTVSIGNGSNRDGRWTFTPTNAGYLRLVCHGNSENEWNSIYEVRLSSLAKDDRAPRVTASASLPDYPAASVVDGNPETRWAISGRDHWIQFRLDPQTATDGIAISWFAAEKRNANFEVLVSTDGRQWNPVQNLRQATASPALSETVDIFKLAGAPNRMLVRTYDVTLERPGEIPVMLTPVKGKAILCGALLEPQF